MNVKTILVTGANGQLGMEFRDLENLYPFKFMFVSRLELPIQNTEAVDGFFNDHKIDICVNCAAYTAVDLAESDSENCFLVNSTGAANLAAASKRHGFQLIHISTDYVFDGTFDKPYLETDAPNPVNTYGASKLEGEKKLMEINPSSIIIRTSWVYSKHGKNFVKTMLRLMKEKSHLNVVNDQFGSPTYAADLARAVMNIISFDNPYQGIYHYANKGRISWFDFAKEIARITQAHCRVAAIDSSGFPTPAKRPQFSVMNTTKIQQTFKISIPDWKDSLQICLEQLNK